MLKDSRNRENFLMALLQKVTSEYKSLLHSYKAIIKKIKPYKIIEIVDISNIPGETIFLIQITNKNCVFKLSAAEIMNQGYSLTDFSEFHASLIQHAAQGKLLDFLKLSENEPAYKIISKKFDLDEQRYIFSLETKNQTMISQTADEISRDKNILLNMDKVDIHEIGYTQGSESILKENQKYKK